MFKDRTIEKRVMGTVRGIIEEAQVALERDAEAAAEELASDLDAVIEKHEGKKNALVETHVKAVFARLAGQS